MNSLTPSDDIKRVLVSAHAVLEQPPPPSLREILTAYRTKGDGDRDMLLAMLNAKTAEDQRLSSISSLQRTLLDIYQQSPSSPEQSHYSSRALTNGAYSYPTPAAFSQSPRLEPHHHHTHRVHRHRSRSPPPPSRSHHHHTHIPAIRDAPSHPHSHHSEPPRKRHRTSRSPQMSHAATGVVAYEPPHPSEQFPPSPYSSSERSDSADYSPRSRASMTIGNLLSSGPSREVNGPGDGDRD